MNAQLNEAVMQEIEAGKHDESCEWDAALIGSQQIDKVAGALVAAQGEMEGVGFDSQNPFLRNRYASLGAVISGSRPHLAKHGLAILQVPTTRNGDVNLRTIILHSSGQWLDGGVLGLPIGDEKGKSRAQVAGSIVTYLRRYAWSSVLGLYAEEDTDGNQPPAKPQPRRQEYIPPDDAEGTDLGPQASRSVSGVSKQPELVKVAPEANPDAMKARSRVLNELKAAPGQANRELVDHYCRFVGMLGDGMQLEDWAQFPNTPRRLREFAAKLAEFEQARHQATEVQP